MVIHAPQEAEVTSMEDLAAKLVDPGQFICNRMPNSHMLKFNCLMISTRVIGQMKQVIFSAVLGPRLS